MKHCVWHVISIVSVPTDGNVVQKEAEMNLKYKIFE